MQRFFAQVGELTERAAEGIVDLYVPVADLEEDINALSFRTVWIATISLIVLVIVSALVRDRFPKLKAPLFAMIAMVMSVSTLILVGSTVYLNVTADSGGPVHWHADFEFWACGNELELRDPWGTLSNKVGTATLHEHDDRRIHLEGVVVDDTRDASLGKFMYVVGGAITGNALVVPLGERTFENDIDGDGATNINADQIEPYLDVDSNGVRYAKFLSGQTCGDEEAEVQTFVYRFNEGDDTYEQFKVDNPRDFVIFDNPNVPPGDCIIFEFDVPKEKTDKICEQYGVRDIERCEEFGVEPNQRSICSIRQIDFDSNRDYRIEIEDEEASSEPTENQVPPDQEDDAVEEIT